MPLFLAQQSHYLPCDGESKDSRTASRQENLMLCFHPMVHGVAHGWRHILHFRNVGTECISAVSSHSKNSFCWLQPRCDPPTHLPLGRALTLQFVASWQKPVSDSQKARSQHQYSVMEVFFATLAASITTHSVKLVQPQLTFGVNETLDKQRAVLGTKYSASSKPVVIHDCQLNNTMDHLLCIRQETR